MNSIYSVTGLNTWNSYLFKFTFNYSEALPGKHKSTGLAVVDEIGNTPKKILNSR